MAFWRRRGHAPIVSPRVDRQIIRRIHGRRAPGWNQLRHISCVLSPFERRAFRFSIVFLFCGLAWLGWTAAVRYREQVPADGGRYVEAVVGSPQSINPLFAPVNDVDRDVTRLVYSGLLRYDEQNRLAPDLAARYEVSDDKRIYTLYLKQDALWHDGKPFTSRDVLFTIDAIQNPVVGSPLFVTFQGVSVSVADDYTIRFQLKEPFEPFLSSLTVGILPEHLWGSVPPERMRGHKLSVSPIGTGPFAVKKFLKDDSGAITQYELKRFDRFYRQRAHLSEFVFRFYPDYEGESGAIPAFREQEVTGISFVPYQMREKVQRKHVVLHTLELPQYSAVFFNTANAGPLRSVEARTALTYAIDKERILREVLHRDGRVIEGPILPGFAGYAENREKTPDNAQEANAMLDKFWTRFPSDEYRAMRAEALGKAWNEAHPAVTSTPATATSTDTGAREAERSAAVGRQLKEELQEAQTFYRKTKEGDIVTMSLVTADTPEYRQTAKLIAGFWQEIGILTRLTFVEPRNMTRDVLRDRSYDALLYGVIVGSDPDQYPFWHSSQVDFPGLNLSRYANRAVDAILEKARTETDPATAGEAYRQFEDAILKDRPAAFLYAPTYTYATTDAIRGMGVSRVAHPSDRFADVTNWYMKTKGKWRF